ncbi:hypothetical protein DFJ77DRAFT_451011 [Powellomyces hirtus]|nr:hypothetical protein DFJ77DRAFT_451011 [Powellomyces hirtus]
MPFDLGSLSQSPKLASSPSPLTPSSSEQNFCLLPRIDQLSVLPPDLQHILRNLPFFPRATDSTTKIAGLDEFLADISNVMHIRHYSPGDVVIQEGERARAMFFLIKGIVKVISDDGEINFAELRPGSYFGEIGVLFSVKRTATVTARTKCALAVLTSEDLSSKLNRYPQISDILRARGNERYEQLKKEMEKVGRRLEGLKCDTAAVQPTLQREPSHGCLRELSASRTASRRNSEESSQFKQTTPPEPLLSQAWASPDDFTTSPLGISENLAPPPPSSGASQTNVAESSEDLADLPPGSQAASFAARYGGGRRRASVAVWSDDRLMQFAQTATEKSERSPTEKHAPKMPSVFQRANTHTVLQTAPVFTPAESRGYGVLGRDLMARVFRYLDFRNRMRVRAASMHILRLLLDPQAGLTTDVDLSAWHKRVDDKIIADVVCFCGQTVRNLSLRNCWNVTDKGLAAIAHYAAPGLEALCLASVWDVTDGGIASMARLCSQLKNVDLSNCRKLSDVGVLSVLDSCSEVEVLSMSYCKILSDAVLKHSRWRTVKRLNLQRCTGIRDGGFAAWASPTLSGSTTTEVTMDDASNADSNEAQMELESNPNNSLLADGQWKLMDLDETDNMESSNEDLKEEAAWGSPSPIAPPTQGGFELQELILSDCSFLTDATVTAVAASCHKLQYLSLSFCCALTESFAEPLCTGCPELRALDMSFCGSAITDANLLVLAQRLKRLERLSIRGCVQVTEQGIAYLARYARHLKMLNVSQCKNISEDYVKSTGRDWRLLTCQGLVEVDEEGFRHGDSKALAKATSRRERARASTA